MEETINPKSVRMLQVAPKSRKKLIIGILVILIIIGLAVGLYVIQPKDPLPDNIRKSVEFPLYYPKELPEDYKLDKSSVKIDNNILFFTLNNGSEKITISEQPAPEQHFDFNQTPGFGEIPATAGEAAVGTVNNQYVAIVVAEKTLVNIYGSKETSRDTVVKIAQNMAKD